MALPVCPGRDSALLAGVVVVAEQVVLVRRGEGDVSFLDVSWISLGKDEKDRKMVNTREM
jgi:hypothetical protein